MKMYLWRCSIAMILGLVWYFSDFGRTLVQYFLGFLCCCSTPLLFGNIGRESGTQTDEEDDDKILQENCVEGQDLADGAHSSTPTKIPLGSQYPHVKKSLQQVFECAYGQLVRPWYNVPEPCDSQPLHRALTREFDFVIDQIIRRSTEFDVCEAVVGSIRILTQHLHNATHSDRREPLFSSRSEEVAVLREFSEALVRNIFPESLWSQDVSRCALNEIVALKGLELLVRWLSDPDNLNQLVVSQLDRVTPKDSVEQLSRSDSERGSLASREGEGEGSEASMEDAENTVSRRKHKFKKKGNKLKEGWSKFVDKMKSKKAKKKEMKKLEQELMMRVLSLQGDDEDEECISRGSDHSQLGSDGDDSDLEDYLASVQEDMMEFKLSYEMWRVGRWAVSIPHVEWESECEELILTIHLEEKDNPENLHWDIKKAHMDLIYFRNRWQDSTNLPPIPVPESSEREVSDEVQAEIRLSAELFLKEVVSDELIGHTQPVFLFLCPLDKLLSEEEHSGGVWWLLSGLAYFLTPGHEEEENSSHHTEEATRENLICPHPEGSTSAESSDPSSETLPTILISPSDAPSEPCEADEETQSVVGPDCSSNECCSQDKTEDVDNPLTSHLKMIFRGLTSSRSQESLASSKSASDEDQMGSDFTPHSSQNGGTDGPSWHIGGLTLKKEKMCFKMSVGLPKTKGKDQGEEHQDLKNQASWEQQEATKAIFDLLKEISGNSILLNIFDAILKPVMPILKKKVNSFLNKMNPTEAQMAVYVDTLGEKQWPECPAAAPRSPRSAEEKSETRDRAHHLICTKYSNFLILKKTDVEAVFNLFQDGEENKKLVYMLLSFLLKEFLPNENALNVSAAALQKFTSSSN